MSNLRTRRSDENRMPLILGAAAVAAVILFIFLLMPRNQSSDQLDEIRNRLQVTEKRIAELDEENFKLNQQVSEVKQTMGMFNTEAERFQAIPVEIENTEKKIEFLSSRIGSLEKRITGRSNSSSSGRSTATSSKTIRRKVSPAKQTAPVRKPAPKPAPARKPAPRPAPIKPVGSKYHTVNDDETLYSIADRYGLTVEKLRALNSLSPDALIFPGQKLVVR